MSRAATVPADRRFARRYILDWTTTLVFAPTGGERVEVDARLRDLSSNGAFVYLENCPPIGARLTVAMKLPLEREVWMNCDGVVVRVENQLFRNGLAVEFDTSRPKFSSTPTPKVKAASTSNPLKDLS